MNLPSTEDVAEPSGAPILSVLGIAGHVYATEALSRRFGVPVDLILGWGSGSDYLRDIDPKVVGRVYSLADFVAEHQSGCEAASDDDVINESREIEQRIGLAAVNPHHYFDRNLRRITNWRAAIRRHLIHLRFVEEVLVDKRYLFIRGENVTQIGCMIQQVARGLGHRYLRPLNARIAGRLEMEGDVPGELLGWETAFRSIRDGRAGGMEDRIEEATEWLDGFRRLPERPKYTITYARNRSNPLKRGWTYVKLGAGRVSRGLRNRRQHGKFDRESKSTRLPGLNFIEHVLWPDVRALIQGRRRLFKGKFNGHGDYVYFPLHYSPEISTLVYGYRHEEQLNLIRAIAAYLPTGYRLVVKEHTAMLGRRPYSFYKALDRLYNVEIVSPSVSTFDLTMSARAVATITGTAGFEAYAMGSRVIACGEVFYRQFPGVLGLEIDADMGSRLAEFLAQPPPDDETIRACFNAYFVCTHRSTMVDVGEDTDKSSAVAEADNFAIACEQSLLALEETDQHGAVAGQEA
ncbi:MAG: hypothetical protein MK116_03380 [Phycisphaerales bacterium]|nr:hypothetical protein [Phycisphaerales bacterium]